MEPGEYFLAEGGIQANGGLETVTISVENSGDRPIQVGSHVHFFEANRMLVFPRERAYGFRLNIPSGTSVRFEPGDAREVILVAYGGRRVVHGFGGLVNGDLDQKRSSALSLARERGYRGA
jgi:urease subunit beta